MNINVGINEITISESDILNVGEYNIHDCSFTFDEVYEGLVKKAQFSDNAHTYQVSIENNRCPIPYEVLQKDGNITIGVYAYEVDGTDLVLRYSPKPVAKFINVGSYKSTYDNYEEVTATDKEQMEQALARFNVEMSKEGTTATIEVTNTDGTTQTVQLYDGAKGDKGDKGDKR